MTKAVSKPTRVEASGSMPMTAYLAAAFCIVALGLVGSVLRAIRAKP